MKPSIAGIAGTTNHPVRAGVAEGRARVVIRPVMARSTGYRAEHDESSGVLSSWILLLWTRKEEVSRRAGANPRMKIAPTK